MEKGLTKIDVTLEGISGILFDRFIDHSTEKRPAEQKLYLIDDNQAVLPAENILSGFLFGSDPKGCAKTFEGKKGADYIKTGLSHLVITPDAIPFLDAKGKPIQFKDFGKGSPFQIVTASPRCKKGAASIKQEAKDRPLLRMPWQLKFNIMLLDNDKIDGTKLYNWFSGGGVILALGTWRPRYGRFAVKSWEIK